MVRTRHKSRRRHWWIPSFTVSGLLHAALITSTLSVPFVVLRGRRSEALAARTLPPILPPVAALPEFVEPERTIEFREQLPDPELSDTFAEEAEPWLVESPEVRPLRSERDGELPPDAERGLPVEARFVPRASESHAFPDHVRVREALPPEPVARAEREARPTEATERPIEPPGEETDEEAPVLLLDRSPQPAYPVVALRMGWEGAVTCQLTIGPEGSVVHVVVERSSGYELLDRAAVEGIRAWRFRPGTRHGLPVEMKVRKRVLFQLPR